MPNLNIGLVGASFVAADRMMPMFAPNGFEVSALFDTDEQRFPLWAEHQIPMVSDDLDAVLGSDIDAVYISSRNEQHAPQALAAAAAGKHILLEKPMALTMADARAVVDAAYRNGVKLAVNHHLPGGPVHSTVRRLVDEGRIGRLYSARINHAVALPQKVREWRLAPVPGGGVILDITVHDASVLNPLFGTMPLRVSALGVSQAPWNVHRTMDSVMTTIEYAAGDGLPKLAQTHEAFGVPFPGTSMEVHGEDGAIVVHDAMTPTIEGTVTWHKPDGSVEDIPTGAGEDLYSINLRRFRDFISDEGTPTVTSDEGLLALAVALAAERSIGEARTIPLEEM
ncbi:MAG: Gfo/Idh/MocA family oxidoreductase [Tetrasphaera sp.]